MGAMSENVSLQISPAITFTSWLDVFIFLNPSFTTMRYLSVSIKECMVRDSARLKSVKATSPALKSIFDIHLEGLDLTPLLSSK